MTSQLGRAAIRWQDALNAALIAACVTLLYAPILGLWWTYDDAFLLRYVITHHPRGYLFSPRIWQEIPQQLFTPVLTLAYDADVVLFGIDARGYYAHHLLELIGFAVLVYAVSRLWHERRERQLRIAGDPRH
jgi:hypothetical protein